MKTVKVAGTGGWRGQPSIDFQYDEGRVHPDDVEWLERYLRDAVASGGRFRDGESIEIGSMHCVFSATRKGLELLEPDFESFPIEFERGVTRTLELFRQQRSVLESFGLEQKMRFSYIVHGAVVCRRYSEVSEWFMMRYEPKGALTGWGITCADDEHDHQDAANRATVSIYELMLNAPDVSPFLALPTGSLVLVPESGPPELKLGNDVHHPLPGSFLAREYAD